VGKCYPAIEIMISGVDSARDLLGWVQRGGDQQVTKLVMSPSLESFKNPSVSHWAGFAALRSLELICLDLSPGLQQLRGLTQLTHLKMAGCSPAFHTIHQLPPSLCSLSLDNLWSDAALDDQQQQEVASTSTQLSHLTSLVLKGDRTASSAVGLITALVNLRQLVVDSGYLVMASMLEPLSQLTSLSSLTVSRLGLGNKGLEGLLVMEKLPVLQQLKVTRQRISPVQGLEVAARLGHLTEIKLDLESARHWWGHVVLGGPLQVRVSGLVAERRESPCPALCENA
jgi:hypothetical protein